MPLLLDIEFIFDHLRYTGIGRSGHRIVCLSPRSAQERAKPYDILFRFTAYRYNTHCVALVGRNPLLLFIKLTDREGDPASFSILSRMWAFPLRSILPTTRHVHHRKLVRVEFPITRLRLNAAGIRMLSVKRRRQIYILPSFFVRTWLFALCYSV